MTVYSERLRTLIDQDWHQMASLVPDVMAKISEQDGFRIFKGAVKRYAEDNCSSGDDRPDGRDRPWRIHSEMTGYLAGVAVLAYRQHIENLEALDRMQQHFSAIDIEEPELA